jgi:uncharacterized protein with GYD domain
LNGLAGPIRTLNEVFRMAFYLLQVSYTSDAWAAMIRHPEDRAAAVREAVQALGGKVGSMWISLGEFDLIGFASMPDNLCAAAFAMAIAAGGACKDVRTTPLLNMSEGIEAMTRASQCGYKPPAVPDDGL